MNALRVIGVVIVALIFLAVIIVINVKKKKENQFSILLRIFTNYIHLISAATSFSIDIPSNFSDTFSRVEGVSSPNETFFSFDCFVSNFEVKAFAPSTSLFKLFLYFFLPLALILGVGVVLGIMKFLGAFTKSKKLAFDFKRVIGISLISIVFVFHPTMTFESLNVFQCSKLDEGVSKMTLNMEYD